jgi:hypothetical protein
MRPPVQKNGVKAGVAQQDFQRAARGGIALEHRSNLLANGGEHGCLYTTLSIARNS